MLCNPGWVNSAAIGVAVIVGFVVIFVFVALVSREKADGTTPRGIVRQLQRTRKPVYSSIGTLDSTWNPAKPVGPDNGIIGPGRSKYSLDEAGVVHLVFQPKAGAARHFKGPIPESILNEPPHQAKVRKLMRGARIAYAFALIGGFVIGFVVAGGSPAHHLAGGGVGFLVMFFVIWTAALLMRVVVSLHKVRRDGEAAPAP
jgi:hypothetical protein